MDKSEKGGKRRGKIRPDQAESGDKIGSKFDPDRIEESHKRIDELSKSIERLKEVNESMRGEIEKITSNHEILSRRLLEMLERDRRDLAMMLYDHAGQVLIALKMDLEKVEKKELDADTLDNVGAAKAKASELIKLIRRTSRKLRPSVLDNLGLVPATRSLVHEFEGEIDARIDFFTAGLEKRLAPEKETALFRILQEGLGNSIKYASADRIHISLIKRGNRVLLTVEDNGNGFDCQVIVRSGERNHTAGIALMRERTLQAGGEFWIESQPGKGTSVMAEIPAD